MVVRNDIVLRRNLPLRVRIDVLLRDLAISASNNSITKRAKLIAEHLEIEGTNVLSIVRRAESILYGDEEDGSKNSIVIYLNTSKTDGETNGEDMLLVKRHRSPPSPAPTGYPPSSAHAPSPEEQPSSKQWSESQSKVAKYDPSVPQNEASKLSRWRHALNRWVITAATWTLVVLNCLRTTVAIIRKKSETLLKIFQHCPYVMFDLMANADRIWMIWAQVKQTRGLGRYRMFMMYLQLMSAVVGLLRGFQDALDGLAKTVEGLTPKGASPSTRQYTDGYNQGQYTGGYYQPGYRSDDAYRSHETRHWDYSDESTSGSQPMLLLPPPGATVNVEKVDLFTQMFSNVISVPAVALTSFFVGSGLTFVVLHFRARTWST